MSTTDSHVDWFRNDRAGQESLQNHLAQSLHDHKLHLIADSFALKYWFMGLLTSLPASSTNNLLANYLKIETDQLVSVMIHNTSTNNRLDTRVLIVNTKKIDSSDNSTMKKLDSDVANILLDEQQNLRDIFNISFENQIEVKILRIYVFKPINSSDDLFQVELLNESRSITIPAKIDDSIMQDYHAFQKYNAKTNGAPCFLMHNLNPITNFISSKNESLANDVLHLVSSFYLSNYKIFSGENFTSLILYSTMSILEFHLSSMLRLRARVELGLDNELRYVFYEPYSAQKQIQPFMLYEQSANKKSLLYYNQKLVKYTRYESYSALGIFCKQDECLWEINNIHREQKPPTFLNTVTKLLIKANRKESVADVLIDLKETILFQYEPYNLDELSASIVSKASSGNHPSTMISAIFLHEETFLNRDMRTFIFALKSASLVINLHACKQHSSKNAKSIPDLSELGLKINSILNIGCKGTFDDVVFGNETTLYKGDFLPNSSVIFSNCGENCEKFDKKQGEIKFIFNQVFADVEVLREIHSNPSYVFGMVLSQLVLINSWNETNHENKIKMGIIALHEFLSERSISNNMMNQGMISYMFENQLFLINVKEYDENIDETENYINIRREFLKSAKLSGNVCPIYVEYMLSWKEDRLMIKSFCKTQMEGKKDKESIRIVSCNVKSSEVFSEHFFDINNIKILDASQRNESLQKSECDSIYRNTIKSRKTRQRKIYITAGNSAINKLTNSEQFLKTLEIPKYLNLGYKNIFPRAYKLLKQDNIRLVVHGLKQRDSEPKYVEFDNAIYQSESNISNEKIAKKTREETIDIQYNKLIQTIRIPFSKFGSLLSFYRQTSSEKPLGYSLQTPPNLENVFVDIDGSHAMLETERKIQEDLATRITETFKKEADIKFLAVPDFDITVQHCKPKPRYLAKMRWWNIFAIPLLLVEAAITDLKVHTCTFVPVEKDNNAADFLSGKSKKYVKFLPKTDPNSRIEALDWSPYYGDDYISIRTYDVNGMLGLEKKDSSPERNKFVALLSKGQDSINGFENMPNLYIMKHGIKNIKAGNVANTFVINTDQHVSGFIQGGECENILDYSQYLNINITVHFEETDSNLQKLLTLNQITNEHLLLSQITEIRGRHNEPDIVKARCNLKNIDLKGGNKKQWDIVYFEETSCEKNTSIILYSNTQVEHNPNTGTFRYMVHAGPATINVANLNRYQNDHIIFVKYDLINFALFYKKKFNEGIELRYDLKIFLKPLNASQHFLKVRNIHENVTLVFSDGYILKFNQSNMFGMYVSDFYQKKFDVSDDTIEMSKLDTIETLDVHASEVKIELNRPKASKNLKYDFQITSTESDDTTNQLYIINVETKQNGNETFHAPNIQLSPNYSEGKGIILDFSRLTVSFINTTDIKTSIETEADGNHIKLILSQSKDNSSIELVTRVTIKDANLNNRSKSIVFNGISYHQNTISGIESVGKKPIPLKFADVIILNPQRVKVEYVFGMRLYSSKHMDIIYSGNLIQMFPCSLIIQGRCKPMSIIFNDYKKWNDISNCIAFQ